MDLTVGFDIGSNVFDIIESVEELSALAFDQEQAKVLEAKIVNLIAESLGGHVI